MTLEDSLKSLNPQQLEAVNYDEGPCLIVAGAGTGKTKTLTTKIAKLIADGYNPARILAVTFTNKAAQEMRERVEALVPGAGNRVWIHTFHSFGVRMLRQNAQALGLSRDFAIYDDSDQKKVVSLILQQMGIKDPKKEINQIVSLISRAKDDMVSPDTLMQSATASGLDFKIRAAEVYRRYEQKLKEAGALDFGDLLVKTVVLLKDHEDVRNYYQDFFQYILVDEYQDTNHTQYLITKMLAAKRRKLCVVGDPDQSIYSWRGDMLLTDPADIFHKILVESGYMDAVKAEMEKDPEAESRLQNLDALINAVKEYEERCRKGEKEPSVADFLQEISLLSGEDDSQAGEGGAVTLMTVHLAKGLEFDDVFVTGLEETLFPISRDNEDDLEEERRLCYVAMTRARERLYLSYAQSRRKFGQLFNNLPSRFLFESGLLDENEVHETPAQPRYTDYRAKYGLYGAGASGPYRGGNYGGGFSRGKNSFGGNRYQNFEGYASKSRFQKRYDQDGYEIEDDDLDYTSSSYGKSAGLGSLYAKPEVPQTYPKGRAYPFPTAPAASQAPAEPGPKNADGVAVGGLVKHGVFGQGKIVAVAGSGDSAKITVLFGNGVRRTFMLKFAPLEIL